MKLAVLPGDGIGPEIVAEAMKVIDYLRSDSSLDVETEHGLIGGASYDAHGEPLTKETLEKAKTADAVLLGAVGGHKWESLPIAVRPEKGLLGLRGVVQVGRDRVAARRRATATGPAGLVSQDLARGLAVFLPDDLLDAGVVHGNVSFGRCNQHSHVPRAGPEVRMPLQQFSVR